MTLTALMQDEEVQIFARIVDVGWTEVNRMDDAISREQAIEALRRKAWVVTRTA